MRMIAKRNNIEFWVAYNPDTHNFVVFLSPSGQGRLGEAQTIGLARLIVADYLEGGG